MYIYIYAMSYHYHMDPLSDLQLPFMASVLDPSMLQVNFK